MRSIDAARTVTGNRSTAASPASRVPPAREWDAPRAHPDDLRSSWLLDPESSPTERRVAELAPAHGAEIQFVPLPARRYPLAAMHVRDILRQVRIRVRMCKKTCGEQPKEKR